MTNEMKQKPVETVRVGGVSIAIWENTGEDGNYYKAGAPELRYRDKDGNWQDGRSYGRRDLVNLAKAALLADSIISKKGHEATPADTEEAA